QMMNMWVATSGRTPDTPVVITGALGLISYANDSEAIIKAGAKINQDPAFWNPAQSVGVSADTTIDLINVAGVFNLELTFNGIRNAVLRGEVVETPPYKKRGQSGGTVKLKADMQKSWRSSPISPFGNQAKSLGLGGSILIQSMDNHTIARIEAAHVHTGSAEGLSVNANEKLYSFEIAQTGGDSGSIGFSGSVSMGDMVSETVAHIDSGADVTGGPVTVSADSVVDHINLTGAVQLAKEVGIGVSVGMTGITRETVALIGQRQTADDTAVGTEGTSFDVSGLTVRSTAGGKIWGIGVAGAVVSDVANTDLFGNRPLRTQVPSKNPSPRPSRPAPPLPPPGPRPARPGAGGAPPNPPAAPPPPRLKAANAPAGPAQALAPTHAPTPHLGRDRHLRRRQSQCAQGHDAGLRQRQWRLP